MPMLRRALLCAPAVACLAITLLVTQLASMPASPAPVSKKTATDFNRQRLIETLDQTIAGDLAQRHALGMIAVAPVGSAPVQENFWTIAELPRPQICFVPGTTSDEVQSVMDQMPWFNENLSGPRFNQVSRWSVTATNGGTGNQGDPITLTYSFPPDGTTIPQLLADFPSRPNDFNAWMNGIYGSQVVWQPIYDDVFARWSELTGIDYTFEPNDDGVNLNQNPGILGVRGDVRIAGMLLDGNSGTLAYNNFPNDGDMVFDTADNFYNDTSGNSLGLRNVIAHEHGHGIGQAHVCPINGSKLMEPFINLGFDGPQHDDVRNAHGFYGDPFEPNNSVAQATALAPFNIPSARLIGQEPAPFFDDGSTISIDANGEVDVYELTINAQASLTLTLLPIGLDYEDTPQACGGLPGACCTGSFTDSSIQADLAIEVIDTDGSTVIASANNSPAGSTEVLNGIILDAAGTYYLRIFETGPVSQPQLYQVLVNAADLPFIPLSIETPNGTPDELMPGMTTDFDVVINVNDENIVPGTAELAFRYSGGAFQTTPLTANGGNSFTATLPPANCDDTPEFFIQVEGDQSGLLTLPATGGSNPFTAIVGAVLKPLDNNGESSVGFTPTGNATEGDWENDFPEGNNRGDPPVDFDGSGRCWLTETDPGDVNSDIDGGSVTLTSPVVDVSTLDNPIVSYARWFDNTAGAEPNQDVMVVEVSDNGGGSWTELETVGPGGAEAAGGWFFVSFEIAQFVTPTENFRIRWTASDADPGSIVEAGIDAISVSGTDCEDVVVMPPAAPNNVAATDNTLCNAIEITWDASAEATTYDVYRNDVDDAGSATLIASGLAGLSFSDTPTDSGFYFVAACNGNGCSNLSLSDSGSAGPAGDFNLDGLTDGRDIAGMVDALINTGDLCGDLDGNAATELADIADFVALLLGS